MDFTFEETNIIKMFYSKDRKQTISRICSYAQKEENEEIRYLLEQSSKKLKMISDSLYSKLTFQYVPSVSDTD